MTNEFFKQPYQPDEYKSFFRQFLPDDFEPKGEVLGYSGCELVKGIRFIGECKSLDLKVYEIKHSSENDPRVTLSKEAFKLIQKYNSQRALVIFTSDSSQNYRLSLITFQRVQRTDTKVKKEFSNPRRYSFFLGPDAKVNTPTKFLIQKGKVGNFEDLVARFSIEVVNKEFYFQIAKFFSRLTGGERRFGSRTEQFNPEMVLPSVNSEDKKTHQEFTVRLIGRIIFCWFLKQKKSKNGISLLPDEFLSKEAVGDVTDYYHSVLEKIFFEVLNKPVNQRRSDLQNGYAKIPYLNGGLFDPHADDFYEGQSNYGLKIPDSWFSELFEVLETYNFTIDENTVLDIDLSIDPEMLGRIFENLLAEINPETGESARKSTGSYYTPRSIVEYMVDQSLTHYLMVRTGIMEEKINALVSIDESDDEIYPLNHEEKQKVIAALDEVKIIDPACGSGAFPIGILQKIVFVLGRIDQNGQLWFEKKTENLDSLLANDFKKKFENENFDYIRKTGVIRDSIYGVDIQPIAVEVSKLRCFLTLIVDEDIDDNAENRGIKPLPNLEFKFVAANTLLDLPGSGSNGGQVGIFEENAEIELLKKLRDQYFVSNGFDKERIKNRFKDTQKEMFKKQITKSGFGHMTMALADWDPFSNKSSGWFDPEWMFGIKEFDIVIGNPPYLQLQKNKQISDVLSRSGYKTYTKSADLYCLFYEKGICFLKERGVLVFITSNSWMRTKYGQMLRRFFTNQANPIQLVNFEDTQIFDAAIVESSILAIEKYNFQNRLHAVNIGDDYSKDTNLSEYLLHKNITLDSLSEDGWIVDNVESMGLKRKIERGSKTIKELGLQINYGLRSGLNEVYIIDEAQKNKLVSADKKNEEVIRPLLRGRDLTKYGYNFANLWVVLAKYKDHKNIETNFPIIYDYLSKFEPNLKNRGQVQAGSHHWIELDNSPTDEYLSNFRKPKIIWIVLSDKGKFAYDENNYLTTDSCFVMSGQHLKYLLAILNSKLAEWYFAKISTSSGMGTNMWKKYKIEQFPIKVVAAQDRKPIEDKVDEILSLKRSNPWDSPVQLEEEINGLVYNLYDLTTEEIKIIEDSVK
jgi:hypothetical protein